MSDSKESVFHIAEMDCPSEESLVRMKLEGMEEVSSLEFDLHRRLLTVVHRGDVGGIEEKLAELDLGTELRSSGEADESRLTAEKRTSRRQRRILLTVLLINFGFFLIEMTTGVLAGSMGLVADSLDMLADAVVYALSLWAVGAALRRKRRVATMAGYFQLTLAGLGLMEVIRRFIGGGETPEFMTMIVVSLLALLANSFCLYLLQRSKDKEAHMQASMIFTSNDVIINSGVILAGVLVLLTGSKLPDLIVGTAVFIVVLRGALRILKLGKG
ncbi:MAG: cation transporter [Spirochaetaceae bacterium]